MLNKSRSILTHHMDALKRSFGVLIKKPLSTLMTVLVIAITLTLPALFWTFSDNIKSLTQSWQQSGHISLYLNKSISVAEQAELLGRVKTTEGVMDASLKSSDDGLLELQQQEGMQDIMQYLSENPLPAVIDVVLQPTIDTSEKLDSLCAVLRAYPQVEQVKLDMQWMSRLQTILHLITNLAQGLMILLALAVILIIGNTLRLAIHHRQNEIKVLKLVGATDAFITRPFLYLGILYGFAGAILAICFVSVFMFRLEWAIDKLATAYQMHYPLQGLSARQIMLLLFTAMILGWLSARLSVKRQLAAIEPCG